MYNKCINELMVNVILSQLSRNLGGGDLIVDGNTVTFLFNLFSQNQLLIKAGAFYVPAFFYGIHFNKNFMY